VHRPLRMLPAVLLVLAGCTGPLLDQPGQQREHDLFLPPLVTVSSSPDGSSWDWNALIWLVGQDVESERRHTRVLPFWWSSSAPPYSETTLLFPLWFQRTTAVSTTRFYSLLYGYVDGPELRTDYFLPPIFWVERSHDGNLRHSSLLFVWDEKREGPQHQLTVIPLLGLAHLLRLERGLPADGEQVPALGRDSSRRFELVNILGLVSAFGWDDVGDRRDIRLLTILSSEKLSLFRSWRGRGDDPFVREWLFPLYMNVQDEAEGWAYAGPLWGEWHDGSSRTDWWALGLLARNRSSAGETWRVLGLPVVGP
jgi:hypothetical protein